MFHSTIAVLRAGSYKLPQYRKAIGEISLGYQERYGQTRLDELLADGLTRGDAEQVVALEKESFAREQFAKIIRGKAEYVPDEAAEQAGKD